MSVGTSFGWEEGGRNSGYDVEGSADVGGRRGAGEEEVVAARIKGAERRRVSGGLVGSMMASGAGGEGETRSGRAVHVRTPGAGRERTHRTSCS